MKAIRTAFNRQLLARLLRGIGHEPVEASDGREALDRLRAPDEPPIDPSLKAGLYALDAKTGAIKWMYSPAPPPGGGRARNATFSTAPTVIDGVVVAAALDGTVYAIDAADGKLLWSYQTAKTYETANGVPGKGGSVDANAITAANGMLFVTSGYGQFGEIPGNVLLAFKPKTN